MSPALWVFSCSVSPGSATPKAGLGRDAVATLLMVRRVRSKALMAESSEIKKLLNFYLYVEMCCWKATKS
jgi:hypothetical protein